MFLYKTIFSIALCLLTGLTVRAQADLQRKWITQKDSAAWERLLDPANYGLQQNTPVALPDQWLSDTAISADSLFYLISNWDQYRQPKKTGVICRFWVQLDTNVRVPYLVYIPKGYDARRKTTLLVYYKGGWMSRQRFPNQYWKEIVTDNPSFDYLDAANIIEIFPVLRQDLAIYGKYGYDHLKLMVRDTRERFNIDDNKIFLTGFSDGGKSVYNTSFLLQTSFACFYAINGSFPSSPDYPNFSNRPVFSIVAEKDELSVPKSISSKAAYASSLGASWTYYELAGKKHMYHRYAHTVWPLLLQHMQATSRQPLPVHISYDRSSNYAAFTGIDWLQINVNTKLRPAAHHFTDSVHTFSMDGEDRSYLYGEETGQVRAQYFNNRFTITTSLIDTLTIYISPLMVNLEKPVSVVVNGKELFNGVVPASKTFMAQWFMNSFDRSQLFVNKITLAIDP